jgi:hypothetical protein
MTELEDLLDRAAEALLAGDLATIGALTPRIEECAALLQPQERGTADRLCTKATRNARLLEAATRGVKAARLRMTEIAQGPTLTTYDAHGRKAAIAPTGLSAAHRV